MDYMKKIEIDLKNYKEDASVFKRTAVRGIIKRNNNYLVIYSDYGDYKFPGGGMEEGETLEETLIREVKEETGYNVINGSITECIEVFEKRKGEYEDIMEMKSYYFLCDVEDDAGNRNLDDYEKEYNYQVEWLPLEEIVRRNETVEDFSNIPWIIRENQVMKVLMEDEKENK